MDSFTLGTIGILCEIYRCSKGMLCKGRICDSIRSMNKTANDEKTLIYPIINHQISRCSSKTFSAAHNHEQYITCQPILYIMSHYIGV